MNKWKTLTFILVLLGAGVLSFRLIDKTSPSPFDIVFESPKGELKVSHFKGKVTFLYFGFLTCPDACPTTLSAVAAALRQLTPAELNQVEFVFVDLDPERDSMENLQQYMSHFHPKFIPVRGDIEEIRKFARLYGVAFQKVKVSSEIGYTIDHTTDLIILNKKGEPAGYIPLSSNSQKILSFVRSIL